MATEYDRIGGEAAPAEVHVAAAQVAVVPVAAVPVARPTDQEGSPAGPISSTTYSDADPRDVPAGPAVPDSPALAPVATPAAIEVRVTHSGIVPVLLPIEERVARLRAAGLLRSGSAQPSDAAPVRVFTYTLS